MTYRFLESVESRLRRDPLAGVDLTHPAVVAFVERVQHAPTSAALMACFRDAVAPVDDAARRTLVARHATRIIPPLVNAAWDAEIPVLAALMANPAMRQAQWQQLASLVCAALPGLNTWRAIAAAQEWVTRYPGQAAAYLLVPFAVACADVATHEDATNAVWEFIAETPEFPAPFIAQLVRLALARQVVRADRQSTTAPPALTVCPHILRHPNATPDLWRLVAHSPAWGAVAPILVHHAPARAVPDVWQAFRSYRDAAGASRADVLTALLPDAPRHEVPGLLQRLVDDYPDRLLPWAFTDVFRARRDLLASDLAPLFGPTLLPELREEAMALVATMRFADPADRAPAAEASPASRAIRR